MTLKINSGLDIDPGVEQSPAQLEEVWVGAETEQAEPRTLLRAPSLDPVDVYQRTIARLETVLRPHNPGDGTNYPYIPLPYDEFLRGMQVMGAPNGRSILDVGCGIGTKMVMAWKMGWKVHGIDIYKPYLDVAAEVCPPMATELTDANDYDGYHYHDAVYCFTPIISVRAAAQLVAKIVSRMRPGAYLFLPAWLIEVPGAIRIADSDVWQID